MLDGKLGLPLCSFSRSVFSRTCRAANRHRAPRRQPGAVHLARSTNGTRATVRHSPSPTVGYGRAGTALYASPTRSVVIGRSDGAGSRVAMAELGRDTLACSACSKVNVIPDTY